MLRRRHGMKAPPGSAGVPPAQHWHSFTPLLNPARPATPPGLSFGRAHGVSAGSAAGCPIAGKRSGSQRHSMRAGRPRSRRGASSHPSCSTRRHRPRRCGRAVPLRVPSVKHPIVNKDEPRMDTKTDGPAWLQRRHGRKSLPGARASRPHNTGTASPVSSTRLDRQRRQDSPLAGPRGFSAGRVAGCPIAGKRSGSQRHGMRAGRPRSRGCPLAAHTGYNRAARRPPARFESADQAWSTPLRGVPCALASC